MWSSPYTCSEGVVSDSPQRIAIRLKCSEFTESKCETLIENGLRFIILEMYGDESEDVLSGMPKTMEKLSSMCSNEEKLVIAIEFHANKYDDDEIEDLLVFLDPDIVIVIYLIDAISTITFTDMLQKILRKLRNKRCRVGIGLIPASEVQWILENVQSKLQIVSLEELHPPNLQLRTVEFLHSRGLNVIVTLSMTNTERFYYINEMATVHGKSLIAFLTKVLLQLGLLVAFKDVNLEDVRSTFREELIPLGHPFTRRGQHMAPSVIKRFVVEAEHVSALSRLSEEKEATEDARWMDFALTSSPPLVLADIDRRLS